MSYIGTAPTIGNFQVCDAISVVNGQASYTMQVSGVNATPQSANHMLVSLNGILQAPNSSFTVSGSTITFSSNLVTGDVIDFIQILGDVLDLGVPSDNTVTASKLNNDIISGTTALTSEPADTDEFLVSDAGTLKRIDYSLIKSSGGIISSHYDDSQSSTTTTSLSFIHTYAPVVAITPASTSSKFLVIASGCIFNTNNSFTNGLTIFRDSTNLSGTTADDGDMVLIEFGHHNYSMVYLDSPNTTSQITYKIGYRTTNASGGARINPNNTQSQIMVLEF